MKSLTGIPLGMVREVEIMGWFILWVLLAILILLFNYGAHMNDEDD